MEYEILISGISLFSLLALITVFALVISSFLVKLLCPIAQRVRLVDIPGGRKRHQQQTPLIGGIAIYLAFLLSTVTLSLFGLYIPHCTKLLVLGSILLVIGAIDDRYHLSARIRLVVQIIVALVAIYWIHVEITDLGTLFSSSIYDLHYLSLPFTVVAIVGSINAINMMDGVDGLIGSTSSVLISMCIAASLISDYHPGMVVLLCVALGSLLGFLTHNARLGNKRCARTFMGDSGTMFLGLIVAYLLITLTQGDYRAIAPTTAPWIFGLPLLDTLRLMIQRAFRKRSPFGADRSHLHHIFLRAGFSVNQTVAAISGLQMLLGSLGLVCFYMSVPGWIMLWAFIGTLGLYYWCTMLAPRFVRWHKRRSRYVSGLAIPGRA